MTKYKISFFLCCFCQIFFVLQGVGCRSEPQVATSVAKEEELSQKPKPYKSDPNTRIIDRIVAVVNNEIILLSQLEQEVSVEYQSKPNPPKESAAGQKKLAELRSDVLDRMIDIMLILQQEQDPVIGATIRQSAPPFSEEIIQKSKELVKAQNGLNDEQLSEMIKAYGMTEEEFRSQLWKRFRTERVLNIAVYSKVRVTEEELRKRYEQVSQKPTAGNLKVHILQVFIPVAFNSSSSTSSTEIADKQKLASSLAKKLQAGQEFQTVAKEYEGQGVSSSVDLGFVSIKDLPDELKQTIVLMGKNEVQGPIRSDRGFHIVKLLEKRNEDIRSFEEAKDGLFQQLTLQRRDDAQKVWVKQLRRKAYIDIRLDTPK